MGKKRDAATTASTPPAPTGAEVVAAPSIPEVPRRVDGTYPKGVSGNPGGRPKGIVEPIPRGYVKRLVLGVIQCDEERVRRALLTAATSHRTVVTVLDHAAKLNKEIGTGADGGGGNTVINVITNVNVLRLKQAASRAAPREAIGAGETGR